MCFFSRLFQKKDISSKKYRLQMARSLNTKLLRYVTERTDAGEIVIGKDGHISVRNDILSVYGRADPLFQAHCEDVMAAELMSHDGVVLEGFDLVKKCHRKVVAHYKYYRK
ncbi:MAG TPA: hypothetical protein DCY74_07360 [Clostridiales bacterium]|jgi:hypothetical protein|nr:hypothetical protein [Clostridiales bacterium]HBE13971.1 hypothetical protein [Clostridiales bacterium]HCG36213.1 hypothetical protein [Clostridiales bacterium]